MTESFTDPEAELPTDDPPAKDRQVRDETAPAPDVAPNLAPPVDATSLAAGSGATPRD